MLQRLCNHVHNYFVSTRHQGTYTISGGTLSLDWPKDGQRIWIYGSELNDGIYTFKSNGYFNDDGDTAVTLKDEEFTGTICGLKIPPEFDKINQEINEWMGKFYDITMSPFLSESFNGYSYTQKGGYLANRNTGALSWEYYFKERLDPYRKANLCG